MPALTQSLQEFIAHYGYVPIEIPLIEPATLFLTKAGDQVIERLFIFNHHGKEVALRPEFTASAAHRYAERHSAGDVVRWQFGGAIFEDMPGSGSQNYQRTSLGAELIGMAGTMADAEIVGMTAQGLQTEGITDFRLVIGHVGLTRHLLKAFQLDDRAMRFLLNHRGQLHTAGKAAVLEQLDRYLAIQSTDIPTTETAMMSEKGLAMLLGDDKRAMGGRSRDDIARRLLEKQQRSANRAQIIDALDFLEAWSKIHADPNTAFTAMNVFAQHDPVAQTLLAEWVETLEMIELYDFTPTQLIVQPDLARSWDYYTGIVFEIRTNNNRLLAGGGRYDELTRLIGGRENTPAVGFAYYIDEIYEVLGNGASTDENRFTMTANSKVSILWANRLREKGFTVVLDLDSNSQIKILNETTAEFNGKPLTFDQLLESLSS